MTLGHSTIDNVVNGLKTFFSPNSNNEQQLVRTTLGQPDSDRGDQIEVYEDIIIFEDQPTVPRRHRSANRGQQRRNRKVTDLTHIDLEEGESEDDEEEVEALPPPSRYKSQRSEELLQDIYHPA